ncbi:hypothetical protein FO519_000641 [Halicephalobus sp. NKZ332]|nr:hypothetical protein FO519_000641 [Halicephalobus sp. NKZ332]
MNKYLPFLIFFTIMACCTADKLIFTSCARMDVPFLGKVAQAACITSCKFQNCGTGSCQKREGRPVCVCSRCDNGGGGWPSIPGRK